MIFRSRSLARRARTMRHSTKVQLGLAPKPKPFSLGSASKILKSLYPQSSIQSLAMRREKPLWARIALARGWIGRKRFDAITESVTVESPFMAFVGAPVKSAEVPFLQFAAERRAYPEPEARMR